MILTVISITILLFIALVILAQLFYIVFGGYAPFLSTKDEIIKKIVSGIKLKENSIIYELGCGRAGFLRAIEKKFPKIKKLVGVEYFLLPFLIAGIQLSLQKSKIRILKKNFLSVNLKEADVIYCFLNRQTMRKLKEKFLRECKRGTQIISYQFSLPDMVPEQVIDIDGNNRDMVYFYRI